MSYLSFKEYSELGFNKISDEEQFKSLESEVEIMFDSATNYFYVENDIDKDTDKVRVKLFKKAIAFQIDYFSDLGVSNLVELNQQVSNVSVGRTHIEQSGSVNSTNYGKTGIYNLAWKLLKKSGLVNRLVDWV